MTKKKKNISKKKKKTKQKKKVKVFLNSVVFFSRHEYTLLRYDGRLTCPTIIYTISLTVKESRYIIHLHSNSMIITSRDKLHRFNRTPTNAIDRTIVSFQCFQ